MKKGFIAIVLAGIIFSGCSIDGDITNKMKSPDYSKSIERIDNNLNNRGNNQEESENIFEGFIKLVNNGKKPNELIIYIDREIDKVTMERADEMILALEEVQNVYKDNYQQNFFDRDFVSDISNAALKGTDKDIIERINNESLKSIVKEIFNGGYKLVSVEGHVYPMIDYSFLKQYRLFISEELADYIDIMATNSDNLFSNDAALTISLDELGDRILDIEKFNDKYSEFIRRDKLKNIYSNYMRAYLEGLDNSLAYDFRTSIYRDEVIRSFKNLIENNEDSKTADIVKEYLDIIKNNNNKISNKAREFLANLYKEISAETNKYGDTMNYKYINNSLTRLLPEKSGYKWIYHGIVGYGHQMKLENIIKGDKQIKYFISGKVDDMSGGESGKGEDYFNIEVQYIIKNASIIQEKRENMMMDSEFDSLEIIRAPLIKGNKWMQIAIDKSGNDVYLNSEITDINEIDGAKIYTVRYEEQDSDYYEVRMIQEGVGVVSFTKLVNLSDESFEVGYGLYKEISGY